MSMDLKQIFSDHFFEQYWGKEFFHFKNVLKEKPFDGLELEEIVRSHFFSPQDFCMFKDGHMVSERYYTSSAEKMLGIYGSLVDSNKVVEMVHHSKASVKIFGVDRWSKALRDLRQSLAGQTRHFCSANLYFTPPEGNCFSRHKDHYDILILQVEGRKVWYLGGVKEPVDGKGKYATDREVILEAGDILYLPKSMSHYASCDALKSSTHITIGLHRPDHFSFYKYFFDKLHKKYKGEIPLVEGSFAYDEKSLRNEMRKMQIDLNKLLSNEHSFNEFLANYLTENEIGAPFSEKEEA